MKTQTVLTIVVEKTGTGFSAYAKEIDGLVTVGDSLTDLKINFTEVLQHHVDYLREKGESASTDDYAMNYVLDLEQFFDYFNVINKSAFAEHYAGINQSLFRQYTKKLAPLSDEKLLQITRGLHKLASELSDLTIA
jgi:predicted RNase H-like HicB family nuclease